jgi:hypothetical protein
MSLHEDSLELVNRSKLETVVKRPEIRIDFRFQIDRIYIKTQNGLM